MVQEFGSTPNRSIRPVCPLVPHCAGGLNPPSRILALLLSLSFVLQNPAGVYAESSRSTLRVMNVGLEEGSPIPGELSRCFQEGHAGAPVETMLLADQTPYQEEANLERGYGKLDLAYEGALTETLVELIAQKPDGPPLRVLFVGVGRGNEAIEAQMQFGEAIDIWAINREPGLFYDRKTFELRQKRYADPEKALAAFERVRSHLRIVDLEAEIPSFEEKFDVVVFGSGTSLYLRDKIATFNRILRGLVREGGYLFVLTQKIQLTVASNAEGVRLRREYFDGLAQTHPAVEVVSEDAVRFQNIGGFQIPLALTDVIDPVGTRSFQTITSIYRVVSVEEPAVEVLQEYRESALGPILQGLLDLKRIFQKEVFGIVSESEINTFRSMILSDRAEGKVLVIAKDPSSGQMVGYALAERYGEAPSKGEISQVVVRPYFRRGGVGKRLFKKALEELKKLDGERITHVDVYDGSFSDDIGKWAIEFGFKREGGDESRKYILNLNSTGLEEEWPGIPPVRLKKLAEEVQHELGESNNITAALACLHPGLEIDGMRVGETPLISVYQFSLLVWGRTDFLQGTATAKTDRLMRRDEKASERLRILGDVADAIDAIWKEQRDMNVTAIWDRAISDLSRKHKQASLSKREIEQLIEKTLLTLNAVKPGQQIPASHDGKLISAIGRHFQRSFKLDAQNWAAVSRFIRGGSTLEETARSPYQQDEFLTDLPLIRALLVTAWLGAKYGLYKKAPLAGMAPYFTQPAAELRQRAIQGIRSEQGMLNKAQAVHILEEGDQLLGRASTGLEETDLRDPKRVEDFTSRFRKDLGWVYDLSHWKTLPRDLQTILDNLNSARGIFRNRRRDKLIEAHRFLGLARQSLSRFLRAVKVTPVRKGADIYQRQHRQQFIGLLGRYLAELTEMVKDFEPIRIYNPDRLAGWVPRLGSWGPISDEILKLPERKQLSVQKQVDWFLLRRFVRPGEQLEESPLSHTQRNGIPGLIAALRRQLDGNPESAVERISFALDWAGALKRRLYPKGVRSVDADDLFLEVLRTGIPLASAAARSDEEFRENMESLRRFLVDLHGRSSQDLQHHFATVVEPILFYYGGFLPAQRPRTPQRFSDDLALFGVVASAGGDLNKIVPDEFVEAARQLGDFYRDESSLRTVRLPPSPNGRIKVLHPPAGLEEERQVAMGKMLRERWEGWRSLSPSPLPLRAVVFGPSCVDGPFGKAIRILAGLEERVFVDEGMMDSTRAVVQILSLSGPIGPLRYVGTVEEARNFNKFARRAGLEEAIQESVHPAFLKDQLRRIFSAMGIPEGIINAGLEEFAAGLEEVGKAA